MYPPNGSTVSSLIDVVDQNYGYPASVTVDSHLTLTVTSFTITSADGTVVPTTLNLDAGTAAADWAFATPTVALAANTTYTVSFAGSAGGSTIVKTWSFTTPAR